MNEKKKEKFLELLAQTMNISASAKGINFSDCHMRNIKKQDPEFSDKWDSIIDSCCSNIEGTLFELATQGEIKDIYYRGKKVGEKKEISVRAGEILLKAFRPEQYRNNSSVNLQNSKLMDFSELVKEINMGKLNTP